MVTAGSVFGQGFQGGLRGSLKDAGGVVPGVEVTLTNEQTNIKRSTVTNERGEYVFANVDPGNYRSRRPSRATRRSIAAASASARSSSSRSTSTMEVGAITENVTVTGQAPLIETVERLDRARCSTRRRCRRCRRPVATRS